jgi:hypothetical protein
MTNATAIVRRRLRWVVEEASPFYYRIKLPFSSNSIITKEDVMPAVDVVIVAAIVAAFVIFAGVLAWAEHQTRDLPPRARTTRPPIGSMFI